MPVNEPDAELLRLLVDNVTDYAIFVLDTEGNVASWNPGAARIKGYAADEIIGRHFSTFYPQEALDRGWPAHELEVARAQGRFEDEGWRLRKDGSQFWANVVITALRDDAGALRGFAKITRDLTARNARGRIDRLRNVRLAVTHRLSVAGTAVEGAEGVLDAICEHLEWDAGYLWLLDEDASTLICKAGRTRRGAPLPEFHEASIQRTFRVGEGLPGSVWATGQPAQRGDIASDPSFVRMAAAAASDLHAAFA